MEDVLIKAFGQITADESLKRTTLEAVLRQVGPAASTRTAAPHRKGTLRVKRLVAAACTAILLCAVPIGAYAVYKTPTSYVSVDINPSVELGINALGKIVSVTAYNEDGETVIDGLQLLNLNVSQAVRLIVRSACDGGFLSGDGSGFIAITAETNSGAAADTLNSQAQSGALDAMDENGGDTAVITNQIGLDRRDDAAALGITPGKLNLIEKLIELDPAINVEDYLDASVTEIQNRFTELKKQQNHNHNQDQDQLQQHDQDQLQQQDQDQLQQQDQDQLQQHDQDQLQLHDQQQKHDQQQQKDEKNQEKEQNSEQNEQYNQGQNTHNEQLNQEQQKEQNNNGNNKKDSDDTQGGAGDGADPDLSASPSSSPSDSDDQPGNHYGQTDNKSQDNQNGSETSGTSNGNSSGNSNGNSNGNGNSSGNSNGNSNSSGNSNSNGNSNSSGNSNSNGGGHS